MPLTVTEKGTARTEAALKRLQQAMAEIESDRIQNHSIDPCNPDQVTPFAPGTQLRHYKGGLYTVVGTCLIEATLQPGVLYRPLQGDKQDVIWMRPLAEFSDMVPTANGPVARFAPMINPA